MSGTISPVRSTSSTMPTTVSSNNNATRSFRSNISYRDRGLNKIFQDAKLFKGKTEVLPVTGLPDEPGGETFNKFVELNLDCAVENYKRGDLSRPLLLDRNDDIEAAIGPEPKLDDDVDEKNLTCAQKEKFKIVMNKCIEKKELLIQNNMRIFKQMQGQVTPGMTTSLKAVSEFERKEKDLKTLWLLDNVERLNSGVKNVVNTLKQFHDKTKTMCLMCQMNDESNDNWIKRFRAKWNVAELVGDDKIFLPKVDPNDKVHGSMDKPTLLEASKAMFAFLHADKGRNGDLQRDLEKNVDLGLDSCPATMEEACRLLTNEQRRINEQRLRKSGGRRNVNNINGTSYYARTPLSDATNNNNRNENIIPNGKTVIPGIDGKVFTIRCNKCQKWGHYANKCPECSETNVREIKSNDVLTDDDYIIDSGSAHSTLQSHKNVKDIVCLKKEEELICELNSGELNFNKKGKLTTFNDLECYINKLSRANILALHVLNDLPGAHIEHNGSIEDAFYLACDSGKILKFENNGLGLHVYRENDEAKSGRTFAQYLQLVSEREQQMTKKELSRARKARDLHEYLRWPGTKEFERIIKEHNVENAGITVEDMKNADKL